MNKITLTMPSRHQLAVVGTPQQRAVALLLEVFAVLPDLSVTTTGFDAPYEQAQNARWLDLGLPYQTSVRLPKDVRDWLKGRRPAPETVTFHWAKRLR